MYHLLTSNRFKQKKDISINNKLPVSSKLAYEFYNHYVNIVKNTAGMLQLMPQKILTLKITYK